MKKGVRVTPLLLGEMSLEIQDKGEDLSVPSALTTDTQAPACKLEDGHTHIHKLSFKSWFVLHTHTHTRTPLPGASELSGPDP